MSTQYQQPTQYYEQQYPPQNMPYPPQPYPKNSYKKYVYAVVIVLLLYYLYYLYANPTAADPPATSTAADPPATSAVPAVKPFTLGVSFKGPIKIMNNGRSLCMNIIDAVGKYAVDVRDCDGTSAQNFRYNSGRSTIQSVSTDALVYALGNSITGKKYNAADQDTVWNLSQTGIADNAGWVVNGAMYSTPDHPMSYLSLDSATSTGYTISMQPQNTSNPAQQWELYNQAPVEPLLVPSFAASTRFAPIV